MRTLFFLVIFLELICSDSKAQVGRRKMKFNIGIPIDQKSFDILTKRELIILQANEKIQIQDIINIIRIDNTIKMDDLIDLNPVYAKFDSLSNYKFSQLLIDKLNAEYSKGGALYLRKYDVFFGGRPHSNSIFRIK